MMQDRDILFHISDDPRQEQLPRCLFLGPDQASFPHHDSLEHGATAYNYREIACGTFQWHRGGVCLFGVHLYHGFDSVDQVMALFMPGSGRDPGHYVRPHP